MTREAFHAQLDALAEHGAAMCTLAGDLLEQATRAVCDGDEAAARTVVAEAVELDRRRARAEDLVVQLLALQAPVATDLRRVVSALWIVGDAHRMGVLAIHVARATLRRYPDPVVSVPVRSVCARMGRSRWTWPGGIGALLRQLMQRWPRPCPPGTRNSTGCTENCWRRRSTRHGRSGWPRRSTCACPAGSTTDSPSTPARWPTGSSTR
jgi:hypothetical protein